MNVKKLISLLLALVLILSLTACGKTAETAAADENISEKDENEVTPITITVPYESKLKSFEKMFESEYPQYDLQVEYMASGVINGELLRRMAKHHAPDILITNLPSGEAKNYAYDLTSDEITEKYEEQIMKTISDDGKIKYLPLPGTFYGYIVNKTLLDEIGLEVPKTKEDILNILKTSKENNTGVNDKGYGFGLGTIGGTYLGAYFVSDFATDYLSTVDGVKWLSNFNNGNAKFEGTWETAPDFLKTCVDEGYMDPQKLIIYYNQSMSTTSTAFKPEVELPQRTAIIAYADTEIFETVTASSEDEFIMIPMLPENENGNALVSAVANNFIFINKDAESEEKLEGAKKCLEFLSTNVGQGLWIQDTKCYYSYLSDFEVDISHLPDGIQDYVTKQQTYINPFKTEVLTAVGLNLANVVTKGTDISDALKAIDDYVVNGSEEMDTDISVVGTVAVDMLYENSNTRTQETQLGNLVSDAIREMTGADVALVNGGGIRSSLYKGDVTGSDLSAVCPYENLIIVSEMNGATLKEAVTNGIQKTWKPAGQFLQVSGIKYSFTPAKDENDVAELLSLTYENGTEVKDDDILTVAYTNFMGGSGTYVDAGDGFTMLNVYDENTPVNVKLISETGKTFKDAVIQYFNNHKDEEITAELEGRITVVD